MEKAIANLKREGRLTYKGLSQIPLERLAELIRPSGYFNQKALKIKAFIHFLEKTYGGNLHRMFRQETAKLREDLLGIKGIGPETADSILLYAGEHLVFVIDLYTYRVITRHHWAEETIDYAGLQEIFHQRVRKDLELYKDFHAQLVAVGNAFCRKTPNCEHCPLKPLLPKGKRGSSDPGVR